MKKNIILYGIIGSVLLCSTLVCSAAQWDKNDYADAAIESGFYDAKSIKVKGSLVSWTEKYILTGAAATRTTVDLSKHQVCKENIEKKGDVTQYQVDFQIKKGKYRGAAKRYYNKADELLCTNKDTGNEFDTTWSKIERWSPMEQAQYDLVTKYKVMFK